MLFYAVVADSFSIFLCAYVYQKCLIDYLKAHTNFEDLNILNAKQKKFAWFLILNLLIQLFYYSMFLNYQDYENNNTN